MQPVHHISEVFEAIQKVKTASSAFLTNFFPVHSRLQGWVEHGELFSEAGEGFILFFRKDRGFFHLHFCCRNLDDVAPGLSARPERLMVDLVGAEPFVAVLRRSFEAAGFRAYATLRRLARTAQPNVPSWHSATDRVIFAEKAHSRLILEMLSQAFDPYAEQLPQAYEIDSAIDRHEILVVTGDEAPCGLLFFQTQGLTSTLRYWLTGQHYRCKGVGSLLMRRYYAMHPGVRRFLLWVVDMNQNAISKYSHYGFSPDGLVDHVLTN